MASGHPDWQTWSGRSAGGGSMLSYSFTGAIAAGVTGTVDFPVVAAGYENVYQNVTISCNDDTAIHVLTLSRVSDAWLFFRLNFITGGIYDFPGQTITAGEIVRLSLTNNSAVVKTFVGILNYVVRKV